MREEERRREKKRGKREKDIEQRHLRGTSFSRTSNCVGWERICPPGNHFQPCLRLSSCSCKKILSLVYGMALRSLLQQGVTFGDKPFGGPSESRPRGQRCSLECIRLNVSSISNTSGAPRETRRTANDLAPTGGTFCSCILE